MVVRKKTLFSLLAGAALCALASTTAQALPALQLGPGAGNWSFDPVTETWFTDDNPFTVQALANANTSGANGSYAWDSAGAGTQIGYLVLAATPQINFDGFDVTVSNDGGQLSLYTSGYGTPPLQDPNSLAPHGIFSTWFEIYQFDFDGAITQISNTNPLGTGGTGTGDGYVEDIGVVINSLAAGVTGIHIDLFTVDGDGVLDLSASNKNVVNDFAPFSHDAQQGPCCTRVPEPAPMATFGFGLIALAWVRRRFVVSRAVRA